MKKDSDNPLGMIKDPFVGDNFVFGETLCTVQRKNWFQNANQILAFQAATILSLQETKAKYSALKLSQDTPIRLLYEDGMSFMTPLKLLVKFLDGGIHFMGQQIFIRLYGSFETYLFQLIDRTLIESGITEGRLEQSISIIMNKTWDGKFCAMNEKFGIGYKSSKLHKHFKDFPLVFMGGRFEEPLVFMDEIARIRHLIIHNSGIVDNHLAEKYSLPNLEEGKLILLDHRICIEFFAFLNLLTEYIDQLFSLKYNFHRESLNPASVI